MTSCEWSGLLVLHLDLPPPCVFVKIICNVKFKITFLIYIFIFRESLAFATERVFASLSNALGDHDNLPTSLPDELKSFKLYPLEIKYGLLQITESLAFLHNDMKLVHRNISPQSVIINKSGAWKLCGFEFAENNKNPPDKAVSI